VLSTLPWDDQYPAIALDVPQVTERINEMAGPQVMADIGMVVPNILG
jgi:hypothetical protein